MNVADFNLFFAFGNKRLKVTVWGTGGANAIDFRHSSNSRILYNDASQSGKGTFDGGILMVTRDFDAIYTEIAYNIVHDGNGIIDPPRGFYGTSGIYFEGGTKNYSIHHNIIYNVKSAISFPGQKRSRLKISSFTTILAIIVLSILITHL